MIWSLKAGSGSQYTLNILLLTLISYAAGVFGYFIGRYLNGTRIYDYIQSRFFGRYEAFLRRYGGFLLVVAALTPLPYSGICMLVGSVKYNFQKFLMYSSFRFLRFGAYAYILWLVDKI